jgi:hypothetical protein
MKILFVIVVAVCAFSSTQAQVETFEKPFFSSKVAVRLVDPNDEPLVGGRVRLMRRGWTEPIRYGSTNTNGYYDFNVKRPGTYYISVHAPAFREYRIKIKLTRSSRQMVGVTMELAI